MVYLLLDLPQGMSGIIAKIANNLDYLALSVLFLIPNFGAILATFQIQRPTRGYAHAKNKSRQ